MQYILLCKYIEFLPETVLSVYMSILSVICSNTLELHGTCSPRALSADQCSRFLSVTRISSTWDSKHQNDVIHDLEINLLITLTIVFFHWPINRIRPTCWDSQANIYWIDTIIIRSLSSTCVASDGIISFIFKIKWSVGGYFH